MSGRERYTTEELIADLVRVAGLLGAGGVMSGPQYLTIGRITRPTFIKRFGSWRAAMSAAGLQCPTIKGGQQRPCDVCGSAYSFDGGAKARKTCSDACASVLQDRHWSNLRKDRATKQAMRGRARLVLLKATHYLLICVGCGIMEGRIEVHHKDGDCCNNALLNLEARCSLCHKAAHRKGRAA